MRTHYCGDIDAGLIGQEVAVAGWVHRRRDHGGVIFVDLRDREGLLQIVFDPDHAEIFAEAERLRSEYVLAVSGKVRARPEGTVNTKLATGEVEVLATELTVLNVADTPPFHQDEHAHEDLRLRYRYLDLRRADMAARIRLRHRVTRVLREFLDGNGFLDIETPVLTRTTPEGARDYIVPSRTHPGQFFSLPQSPQLFKQLLMMSGFDRYYQIARCFRDEDLRADRQPEFTQLDIEMSFVNEQNVMSMMEALIRDVFSRVLGIELPDPFPRMSHWEAVTRFGTDRPDLRIPLEMVEVSDLMKDVEFKVFAGPAQDEEGRVAALKLPGGGSLTRKAIDDYTDYVGQFGAKGLAYIKVKQISQGREGLQSPILGGSGFGRGGLGAALGGRFSNVRMGRGGTTLGCSASPVYRAECRSPDRARSRAGNHSVARLRYGAERQRDWRRLDPHPFFRYAGGGVSHTRHFGPGSRGQVRFPAAGTALRLPAARRHRVRPRPAGHADGRCGQHPRRDRLSEDPDGELPVDRSPGPGIEATVARDRYTPAQP
jgi:hypothetical protein